MVVDALRGIGVGRSHRVGVLTGNTPLHVDLHRATRTLGAAIVPGDVNAPPAAILAWAERCGVEALVCDESTAALGDALEVPTIVATAEGEVTRMPPRGLGAPTVPAPGITAVVQTSGTTGAPRAVAVPDACLAAHATAACERLGSTPESVWLGVLGLHHIGGVAMVDRCLRTGADLRLLPRFDEAAIGAALPGVSHVSLVPLMLERLLDARVRPPDSLACVLVGGDRLPPALATRALDAGWPVYATYGCTEACSQVATATPEQLREKADTVGRPLTGVRVLAPKDHIGAIEVRGPTVPGGAVRPGDLGWMEDGFLYIAGRVDARIVSGGETIDALAVEAVVASHPDVVEACVVGVPDARWGQRVACALVVSRAWDEVAAGLEAHVRGRLPAAHVPRAWRTVEALPRTASGKVARATVRALFT